jgi:phage/plasmid-associated DNA primase
MYVLAGFLADCCEVGERERAYARELYAAYKRWCEDTGSASRVKRSSVAASRSGVS